MDVYTNYPKYCCPACGKPVGYLGRVLAYIMGYGWHDCDFRNVRLKRINGRWTRDY